MNLYLFKPCDSEICNESYSILSKRSKQIVRVFDLVENSLKDKEVNLILSDQKSVQSLNKTFRKEDKPTDILTFPLGTQIFGELWISPDVISQNAIKFKEEFEKELIRITIHGLLHLAGHDHKGYFEKEKKNPEKIFALQEKILEMLY